jgi:hypothetical protein
MGLISVSYYDEMVIEGGRRVPHTSVLRVGVLAYAERSETLLRTWPSAFHHVQLL